MPGIVLDTVSTAVNKNIENPYLHGTWVVMEEERDNKQVRERKECRDEKYNEEK